MIYLDVVFQLLPPLLYRFGPQVGVPFAREVRGLYNLPELQEPKDRARNSRLDVINKPQLSTKNEGGDVKVYK